MIKNKVLRIGKKSFSYLNAEIKCDIFEFLNNTSVQNETLKAFNRTYIKHLSFSSSLVEIQSLNELKTNKIVNKTLCIFKKNQFSIKSINYKYLFLFINSPFEKKLSNYIRISLIIILISLNAFLTTYKLRLENSIINKGNKNYVSQKRFKNQIIALKNKNRELNEKIFKKFDKILKLPILINTVQLSENTITIQALASKNTFKQLKQYTTSLIIKKLTIEKIYENTVYFHLILDTNA